MVNVKTYNEDILTHTTSIVPVRYLEDTKDQIYNNFIYRDSISKSTFFKYLKRAKIFKKTFRYTDLCDYCEWTKEAKKQIKYILSSIESFEFSENFDSVNLIGYFLGKKKELIEQNGSQESINELEMIVQKLEKITIVEGKLTFEILIS